MSSMARVSISANGKVRVRMRRGGTDGRTSEWTENESLLENFQKSKGSIEGTETG